MNKLISKLSFLFAPILILVVGLNYFADPGGKYNNSDFSKFMTKTIIQNKQYIVFNEKFDNFLDERYLLHQIKIQNQKPKLAVLGSSRILPLSYEMVQEYDFVNFGLRGSKLGDIIAAYQLLFDKNILPPKLIIGMGPEQLMNTTWPIKYDLYPAYEKFLNRTIEGDKSKYVHEDRLFFIKNQFNYYAELFSPKYFQQSIKFLLVNNTKKDKFRIFPHDSSQSRSTNRYTPLQEQINKVRSYAREGPEADFFKKYRDVNPPSAFLFEKLIEDIRKNNIELTIFVTPFNPYFYDEMIRIEGQSNSLTNTDRYLKSLSNKMGEGFYVIGDTNPHVLGINEDQAFLYYFDHVHLSTDGLKALISNNNLFNEKR